MGLIMKYFISCLCCLFITGNLFADITKDSGVPYCSDWGLGADCAGLERCQGDTPWNAETWPHKAASKLRDIKGHCEIPLLIARDIRANGAKFCAMHAGAARHNCSSESYTAYYNAKNEQCFWLCKRGYYGEGCVSQKKDDSSECNGDIFDRFALMTGYGVIQDGLSSSIGSNPTNIENQVPMFVKDNYINCNSTSGGGGLYNFKKMIGYREQEHDVILAVKSFDTTQKKLVVSPVVVRAGTIRDYILNWDKCQKAWPMISWTGNSYYVCPDGWTMDEDGVCTHAGQDSVACKLESLCPSTPRNKFNPNMHEVFGKDEFAKLGLTLPDNCSNVFRCNAGGAFVSTTDFSCVECSGPTMGPGVDGTCVKCRDGFLYSSQKKTCVESKKLSHSDMLYGQGVNSATELSQQCWVHAKPECYQKCVVQGIEKMKEDTNCNTQETQ